MTFDVIVLVAFLAGVVMILVGQNRRRKRKEQ